MAGRRHHRFTPHREFTVKKIVSLVAAFAVFAVVGCDAKPSSATKTTTVTAATK